MIPAGIPAGPAASAARRACAWGVILALVLALTLATPSARAGESLYVIEQLVVAVNSAPAGAGSRVGTLKSGDRVEVLDRQGDEAQVQLANGTAGWVKAAYLSAQLPLQRQLQDRMSEIGKLKQDVSRLESQLSARATVTLPPSVSDTTTGPPGATPSGPAPRGAAVPPAASAGPGAPVRDPSPFMSTGGEPTAQPPWVWILSCSAAALALGFLSGWRMLDRRIRRKYGGLRIY